MSNESICRKIYKGLLKIPIFGDILLIANAYTFDGDMSSNEQFAPISLWFKKHLSNFIIAFILTILSTPTQWFCPSLIPFWPSIATGEHKLIPGNLIISIFPNMLGFGIGVYALIFGLSSILIKKLHENISSSNNEKSLPGSVLILNADMAYPLTVMTGTIAIGVFQQLYFESKTFEIIAWIALWYSLLMVLEVLITLFSLGENELLGKLDDK
jgi:hypothetical protein